MVSGTARRLAAAFLLGAAVGAAATVPYYGRRVEALLLTTGSLLQQLHEHRARLARLEEARDRSFRPVIQRVRLELLHDDEAVRITTARTSHLEDIAKRQKRYLLSMSLRSVCFVGAVIAGIAGINWLWPGLIAGPG